MQRLIHTVALGAALVAVLSCLWGDYGPLVGLKRAVVSYLVFYCVGALLALVYRTGVLAEGRPPAEPQQKAVKSAAGGRDQP
jgi:hypothetical protein